MRETCYCGRTDDLRNRELILDGDGRWALKCPDCGHVDYLEWLPEEAAFLLWGEAKGRRGMRHCHLPGEERARPYAQRTKRGKESSHA